MNEHRDSGALPTDPVFGFYAEAVVQPPRLAMAGAPWEPESIRANQAILEMVGRNMGVRYRPEPRSTRRRILSSAAHKAWELGALRIVFVGTKQYGGDPDERYVSTEAVLVCLYSDWPNEMAAPGLTVDSIPAGARLVHSVVATPDLIGDSLRILRSMEALGTVRDPVGDGEQYPAAA